MVSLRLPKGLLKKLAILPPLVIGVVVAVILINSKREPARRPAEEVALPVRSVLAASLDLVPRTVGYGAAQPAKTWQAVAGISGEITALDPRVKVGAIMREGEELLRIDPTRAELAIQQSLAAIEELEAQIRELEAGGENTRRVLEIERRGVELAEDQLARTEELLETGRESQARLDQDELSLLTRRNAVQNLENSLSLIPSRRDALLARIAVEEAKLGSAQLDLEQATVVAPFDCRISAVEVEIGQYVATGTTMVQAGGIATTEVTAQISIQRLRNLIKYQPRFGEIRELGNRQVRDILKLEAEVRLREGNRVNVWPARFVGLEDQIDPETRTVGVIVAVDGSYETAVPGVQAPLIKGMFVEVELRGSLIEGALLVPVAALNDGAVFLVDEDRRLRRRRVQVDFVQGDLVVLSGGLEPGAEVLVSDPVPPVDGMLLAPIIDADVSARMRSEALGAAATEESPK